MDRTRHRAVEIQTGLKEENANIPLHCRSSFPFQFSAAWDVIRSGHLEYCGMRCRGRTESSQTRGQPATNRSVHGRRSTLYAHRLGEDLRNMVRG
jgi:hypothetical protein